MTGQPSDSGYADGDGTSRVASTKEKPALAGEYLYIRRGKKLTNQDSFENEVNKLAQEMVKESGAEPGSKPDKQMLAKAREDAVKNAVKKDINDLLILKNVHFLFGAGTSSPVIPVMEKLQREFDDKQEKYGDAISVLYEQIKGSADSTNKTLNLEQILGVLYAATYAVKAEGVDKPDPDVLEGAIMEIKKFLIRKVNVLPSAEDASDSECNKTLKIYEDFYRKVAKRNRDLARINVFTTNYDLFNEYALDALQIDYNSGFGGGLTRHFNSARFHYTLSKKLDASIEKFEPMEGMVYLHKLHGSVNWRKSAASKFPLDTEEFVPHGDDGVNGEKALIYPTPLKEGDTLASPYSDLMREMKAKLLLPHSVLFVIGYGFGDEHINNIIYQACSVNSSLSVFVFGKNNSHLPDEDKRFYQLHDMTKYDAKEQGANPSPLHYFDRVVKDLLPAEVIDENERILKFFREAFLKNLGKNSIGEAQ